MNALDPKIDKGQWTPEQDQKLLENVEIFGKGELTLSDIDKVKLTLLTPPGYTDTACYYARCESWRYA